MQSQVVVEAVTLEVVGGVRNEVRIASSDIAATQAAVKLQNRSLVLFAQALAS